jgi:CHAT domain-containing protein/Tfp pilus assembly protein PilF
MVATSIKVFRVALVVTVLMVSFAVPRGSAQTPEEGMESAARGAIEGMMRRYECVTPLGVRTISVTAGRDTALVDAVVAATPSLPTAGAVTEVPTHWRVELRRTGDAWRALDVRPASHDLAAAIASSEPPTQHALLRDCDALLSTELVDQLVEQGVALGSKAKFEREEQLAKIALEIAGVLGDWRARARALWLLGRARDSQQSFDDAMVHYQEAHRLAEAYGDRATAGRALVGLGWTYVNRYEFAKATEPLQQGLKIALAVGDHMIADNAYLAMAEMHILAGEYIDALLDLDRARAEAEKAGDGAVVAAAIANAGIVFITMNNYELARDHLTRAIEIYRRIGSVRGEMRNLRNLAEVEASAHHSAAAAAALERLEPYLKKEPSDRLAAFVAATRSRIARNRHDLVTADREALRALGLAMKMDSKYLIAVLKNALSEIRFEQAHYAEAAELAEQAVKVSLTTGSPLYVYPFAKLNAAKAYRKLGKTDEAFSALYAAVDSIESQSANVPGSEQEQIFYEDKTGPYYEIFRLLVDQLQPEKALEWVERSRSRTLIEFRGRSKATVERSSLSASERDAESGLERAIVSANRSLRALQAAPVKDAARIAEADAEVRQKRLQLEDFEAQLHSRHPELMLARGALPRPSLSQTQKMIPADGAIVEYVAGTDATWVVVIGHTGRPRVARIDIKASELRTRVARFVTHIIRRDLAIHGEARRMYDLVVGPVESLLRSKRSLCVIPDGELWRLPFQALVDSRGQYLIERSALFYAPSRSLLAWYASHHGPSTAQAGLLVVANPRLTEETVQAVRAVRRDESFAPLPDAEHEARGIKAIYGGDVTMVTGAAATEEYLKHNAGRYRIIHMATHAVFDDTSPLYSHLLLATGSDSHEDGLLEAREIVDLDLAADLVILASCETGRGRVRPGEGLIGMSWALLVAGCPTAVVSQWKVASAGTAKLMIDFHRRLSRVPPDGRRAAAARVLREAQLALLRSAQYEYPYDWSGFVVMGNGW